MGNEGLNIQESEVLKNTYEPGRSTARVPEYSKQKTRFILLLIFMTLFFFGTTIFLSYQNIQLNKSLQVNQKNVTPLESAPTPTSDVSAGEIKAIDGNISQLITANEAKILVDKNNYQSEGISGFDKVIISPDGTKMCFLGYVLAPPVWLYVANVDGSGVVKVGLAKNCVWSHDSRKIAFNNHTTDVSPIDIYVYDVLLGRTHNLTESLQSQNKADAVRLYDIPLWSEDDSEVSGKFVATNMSAQDQRSGVSIINVITGKIEDKILSE